MSAERLHDDEDALSAAEDDPPGPRADHGDEVPDRHTHDVASMPIVVEPIGAAEHRVSFRIGDSWSRTSSLDLRGGVRLEVGACYFAPSFAFTVVHAPAELQFVVSKGAVIQTRTTDGHDLRRAGNTLQLVRRRGPLRVEVCSEGDAQTEVVSLSLSERRLRELFGAAELPEAIRRVTESEAPHPLVSQAMTPALYRLLEEISNADVKGAARKLWHEAKSLELIALMTDELVEAARASRPPLSTHDIDRLERVRLRLLQNLEAPPSLAELARMAGFSETKLKGSFRALFGTSLFEYLRRARMEEARNLLLTHRLNVTEVALRVGYANPSKFAAAFRRQVGMSPSEL
ncbi:MAG: helix-turn-helix transcriptional regulator [Minicystis sp.]